MASSHHTFPAIKGETKNTGGNIDEREADDELPDDNVGRALTQLSPGHSENDTTQLIPITVDYEFTAESPSNSNAGNKKNVRPWLKKYKAINRYSRSAPPTDNFSQSKLDSVSLSDSDEYSGYSELSTSFELPINDSPILAHKLPYPPTD